MRRSRRALLFGAVAGVAGATAFWQLGGPIWRPLYSRLFGRRTVDEAVASCAPAAEPELESLHEAAGLKYPPSDVALVATKAERRLEVWGKNTNTPFKRITACAIR